MGENSAALRGVIEPFAAARHQQRRPVWPVWRQLRCVRIYMIALILAVLLPALCFSAFLVLRSAKHEQHFLASTVRERAETASTALDLLLSTTRARLFRIANTATLDHADITEFFSRVARAVSKQH